MTHSTARRVLRWEVPVDDDWHKIGGGQVLHVAVRRDRYTVEVWTLEPSRMARVMVGNEPTDREIATITEPMRTVRVYGTGQAISDADTEHLGTAIAPETLDYMRLVWHLFGAAA